MDDLLRILDQEYFGNSVRAWAAGTGIAFATAFGLLLVRRIVRGRVERLAPRTKFRVGDLLVELLKRTLTLFVLVVGLWAGTRVLEPDGPLPRLTRSLFVLALLLQAGRWAHATLQFVLARWREGREAAGASNDATWSLLNFLGMVAIWSVVLLMSLDNLGFQVTTLLAGLGVGGIAVALAAQNILADLFASLSIALDKPFALKDFLIIGDFLGTVERIGIKTTRLRSLSGEQVIFSNTDLLGSRIRNFGRMFERRVLFTIGVTYQTPREKLARIADMLKTAVLARGAANVRFDRAHFKAYGAFSLDFEVVYYVLSPAYPVYMDHQQAINLAIHEAFEKEGIEFAYPTQTLYVAQNAPRTEDGRP